MTCLKPLWRLWQITYYRWALAECPPDHPDVPFIVLTLNHLERPL